MKAPDEFLKDRWVLVVDDEPDVLETIKEMLDMCKIDTAPDFETANKFLNKNNYDAAILDIMGVRGYDLLAVAASKGIPALMLTAHALSPDHLKRSIQSGAGAYIPKENLADIEDYLVELIHSVNAGTKHSGRWFSKLRPIFNRKFGPGWQETDKEFWREFEDRYVPSREDAKTLL